MVPLFCDSDTLWAAVTALSTTLLAIITIGAVIVGGLAAKAANDTLSLEAQPVLVLRSVRNATYGYEEAPERFVRWDADEHDSNSPADPRVENIYGIAPFTTPQIVSIPPLGVAKELTVRGAEMEVRNVGRSPAVDIKFSALAILGYGPGGRKGNRASGEISIGALAAGEATSFIILNYVPESTVYLKFEPTGSCRDIRAGKKTKSRDLVVIAVSTPRVIDKPFNKAP
jgi:hypothetical protein